MGVGSQRHAPAVKYPGNKACNHCTGGWVGPRAGLDSERKISPQPVCDPRTVASRHTNYAIQARVGNNIYNKQSKV
jgi:hypothetical protein